MLSGLGFVEVVTDIKVIPPRSDGADAYGFISVVDEAAASRLQNTTPMLLIIISIMASL